MSWRHTWPQRLVRDGAQLLVGVLLVGNRPGALARWGLDYESVHDAHPEIVTLHVSGYGLAGPRATGPATAGNMDAAHMPLVANILHKASLAEGDR